MSRAQDPQIEDILDACDELAQVVSLRASAAVPEPVLTHAAERLLEIIGEAANALPHEIRLEYPGVPWREITRLRIVLAHRYQRVDPGQVWAIAEREAPALALALRGLTDPPTP